MSPSIPRSEIPREQLPILIIGGGPSGLLLAFLLQKLGVRSLVIERYPTQLAAPKAHALSPRSLELCRQFGLDVNEIRKIGTRRDDAYWVNFTTSLAGDHVGRLPYERMDAQVLDDTPTMIHNIPQPAFEEILAKRLDGTDLVEIRKNHSFVRLEQDSNGVITTIEDRSSNKTYQIRSEHVVACDGANSAVRRHLQIDSDGEDSYETMMTIHFNADLRPIVQERVGMLHWIMDPFVSGFIIGYDLSGNQVLICNFDSEKRPVESWNEEHCRQVVTTALGCKADFDILSFRPWILSRKVAKSYQQGRVFLAGDAAHSFPPTGGLGLNSGLGDVHNIAYKLAAVHHGWASSRLLDSYDAERRQVALVNSQQSVKNGKKIFSLLRTLGTTDPDLDLARKNLSQALRDEKSMAEIQDGIEGQREHFDNLGLHIGYVYGDKSIPENASVYKPVCVPGARLPHAWIKLLDPSLTNLPTIDCSYISNLGHEEVATMQYSTLDLCRYDSFTILVNAQFAPTIQSAAKTALEKFQTRGKPGPALQIRVQGVDFDVQPGQERWNEVVRLREGQVVLVRPDQHILAVFNHDVCDEDIVGSLKEYLAW
ncbi:FAD binding domain-containing protein [Aspergillus unguis]